MTFDWLDKIDWLHSMGLFETRYILYEYEDVCTPEFADDYFEKRRKK